jgi:hypothetical protein
MTTITTVSLKPLPTMVGNSSETLTIHGRIQQLLNKQDPRDGCNGGNWFSVANQFTFDYDPLISQVMSLDVECKPNQQLFNRRSDFQVQDRLFASLPKVPPRGGCSVGKVIDVTYALWYQRLSEDEESRLSRSNSYIEYLTRLNAFDNNRVNASIFSNCQSGEEGDVNDVGMMISALLLNSTSYSTAESLVRQFLNSANRNAIDDAMGIISPALGSVFAITTNIELKDTIIRYFSLRMRNLQETISYGQLSLLHSSLLYGILTDSTPAEFGTQADFDPYTLPTKQDIPSLLGWVGICSGIVVLLILCIGVGRWFCRPIDTHSKEIPLINDSIIVEVVSIHSDKEK